MYLFDSAIAVTQTAPEHFAADISEHFSINGTPNGGYLLAVLAKAMLQQSDKTATPVLTANYLSRTTPGKAQIAVETISQSRQFTRLEARLGQREKETLRCFGTFAIAPDACFVKRHEAAVPAVADVSECIRIPALPGYSVYENLDIRLDPECAGWMENRLSETSEHKGWLRFPDGRPLDLFAVCLAADAFPPAVMASHGAVAWVPTLEFSVSIRNLPTDGWLRCRFQTRFINCGLLEEDGEIRDENNELIAVSRQIAQFRQIEKQTAPT